jgi:hypothetical protein
MLLALFFAVAQPPSPVAPGPAVRAPALQEAVLARAVFLVQRDACVLVEPDAPSVMAYAFDHKADVALMKTEVAQCEPHASLPALVRAAGIAIVLAARNEPPRSMLPRFNPKALDAAAHKITGKRLLLSTTATANHYDPLALRALFDVLYAKPTERRIGLPLKALYGATLRGVLQRISADIQLVSAKPDLLAAESKRYLEAPTSQADEANDAWRMALNRLVKSDDDAARIDPRLVGFVLRRHADGTLPVIVEILNKIQNDYSGNQLR